MLLTIVNTSTDTIRVHREVATESTARKIMRDHAHHADLAIITAGDETETRYRVRGSRWYAQAPQPQPTPAETETQETQPEAEVEAETQQPEVKKPLWKRMITAVGQTARNAQAKIVQIDKKYEVTARTRKMYHAVRDALSTALAWLARVTSPLHTPAIFLILGCCVYCVSMTFLGWLADWTVIATGEPVYPSLAWAK